MTFKMRRRAILEKAIDEYMSGVIRVL